MNTKEWLNRGREAELRLKILLEEKEKIRELSYGVRTASSGGDAERGVRIQTSHRQKHMLRYDEYVEMIDEQATALLEAKKEILNVISLVNNGELQALLLARYVGGKTWEKIAEDMNRSRYGVSGDLHSRALSAVERRLQEMGGKI